jgi:hypothetical protein
MLVFTVPLWRVATNELEGLPAPLSGVLPDLYFACHDAQEIRPSASRLTN